ncbi:MAG: BamA/TamA family outer membrane protein [Lautropia sp.]|nr:BamA/TamA family outer membrane protein [Lautropia sp.]
MTAPKTPDRFCLMLACLALAGCASLKQGEPDRGSGAVHPAGGHVGQAATAAEEPVYEAGVGVRGEGMVSDQAAGHAAAQAQGDSAEDERVEAGVSPEAGESVRAGESAADADTRGQTGNGADEAAARDGSATKRDPLAKLLGNQRNYRFTIQAPRALREPIERSTLVGRWQRRTDYDPIQFEGLVGKLHDEVLAIARDQGYFNPGIEVSSEAPSAVAVKVDAGVRTHVRKLDVKIEGPGAGKRELRGIRSELGLAEGDVFLPGDWQSGKRGVVEAMQRQGYLRAKIRQSRVQVDAAHGSATLTLVVDTGPRIAFGPLHIQGLERYPLRIVEDLRTFREGDAFTQEALQLFQSRLRAAGYFNSVSALPDLLALAEDPEATAVPIQLVLEEMQRHRVVYGLGYSTEDGPRGQIGFQDRNLYGLQMEASVMLSRRRQRAFTNFRTPLDARNRYYGFGYRLERETEKQVTNLNSNLYVGYGQRMVDIESFTSLQLQLEQDHFRQTGVRDGLKALVLGKAWTLQRFDSMLNPTQGYGVKFEISGASRRLYSDRTFTRFYTSLARLQPMPRESVFRQGILNARAELGVVNAGSSDDIPSENLFRTGGATSIRGYAYRSLGLDVNNKVVGQRYLAVGSLEYLHRLSEMFSVAAFYDYGNVANSWKDMKPVSGYGLGVQASTPVGPVRLDLAYGQAVHRYRVHFSIGYTF